MSTLPLDPQQQVAVDHDTGPCLVIAGPGSGKTRVIVERFLALVDRDVPPAEQLVLTYTRKAAGEMRERAEAAHGPFSGEPPLSNYHSFAQRVVREWGWLVGVSPAFHIADEAERWLHLEAVLSDLKPRTLWNPLRPHDLVDPLLHVIGHAKQELVTPAAYITWAVESLEDCSDPALRAVLERHQECAAVYAALEDRYRAHAVLDHDDCILIAEQLLREQPVARRSVADPIRYVMVDEYQDTNFAQARLVETLVQDHHNIFVVADDDQAIYKFRGASLANLQRFERTYPHHQRVVLANNYRSSASIVTAASVVIDEAAVDSRLPKQLTATRGAGARVDVWDADDERSEMAALAEECRLLIADQAVAPSHIAWLFRRHADMQPAMAALQSADVPFEVHGGRGFFVSREIKDSLALLGAVDCPDDTQALLRCLHLPAWRMSGSGRLALSRAAREHDASLLELVKQGGLADLEPDDNAALQRCVEGIVALASRAERDDVRDLFYDGLELSEFLGVLDTMDEAERRQAGANLSKFGEMLEGFTEWNDDHRVAPALRYLEVLRNSRDADELASVDNDGHGVLLVTAHAAKGLEWPVVVIPHCIEGRWPDRSTPNRRLTLPDALVPETPPAGDSDLDEERRLFYVATTRARDRLIISHASRYPRSFTDERRSPFINAILRQADVALSRTVPPSTASPARHRRPAYSAGTNQRPAFAVLDIDAFKKCPRRFEYRRRYKLPVRQNPQAWYGTLVHNVLQSAANRRLAGNPIDADGISELWTEAWGEARGEKGRHPQLRSYGDDQLRRYILSPAWLDADIVAAEQPFVLPLSAADVRGRFDRLDRRGDDAPVVVDYKTGPPKDASAVARDLQVRAYAVALSQRDQVNRVAVELHYLQTGEVVRADFGEAELKKAYGHISASSAEVADAWRSGVFPAKPSSWLCRRCEFRTVCDEGKDAN